MLLPLLVSPNYSAAADVSFPSLESTGAADLGTQIFLTKSCSVGAEPSADYFFDAVGVRDASVQTSGSDARAPFDLEWFTHPVFDLMSYDWCL